MNHYQLISLNIMTSHKSHRTTKRPRRNQRCGNMVLHSGTSTELKGNMLIPTPSFKQSKPHKSKLLYLTRKKPSFKKKKQVLNQKEGFLLALASLIAPLAIDLLGKVFK